MQSMERVQQNKYNQTIACDNVYENAEFTLNTQAKLDTYLCNEDSMLLNSDVETSRNFKPYQKDYIYSLGLFYEYAMDKYNDENDNRWLMLLNIIEAMINATKEELRDVRMTVAVGKIGKKCFSQYLSAGWDSAWVFISNWKDETQLHFEEIKNGNRTDNSFAFNITLIKDMIISFRSWINEITVCIKYPNVDYKISFYGLNNIIEPLIHKESEDTND